MQNTPLALPERNCVIPRARVLSSGPRDLPATVPCREIPRSA
jgi:hypothetical protein